jgi:hypothetical protein
MNNPYRYNTEKECIQALISKLKAISETHPDIFLDSDIFLAKNTINNQSEKSDVEKTLDVQLAKIKQDLLDRGMTISSVAAINQDNGNQQVMGYDPNGVICFVSNPYPIINLYGAEFGKGGMYSIGNFYTNRAAEIYNTNEEIKRKKKESELKKLEEEKLKSKENSKWRYILSLKWIYEWTW